MPIYEYQCAACGHKLEALQKVSEPALTTCPECHKDALSKLVSATSFQLKGTGWYETDFKTKPKTETKSKKTSKTETPKTDTKENNSTQNSAAAKTNEKSATQDSSKGSSSE